MNYKTLNQTHAEYDPQYWGTIRALAAGGKQLLGDMRLLMKLLPRRPGEEADVYTARLASAFYVPYMGQLIEQYVSSVFNDPFHVEPKAEFDSGGKVKEPDYYDELESNVSGNKNVRKPLNAYLRDQLLTALLCKRAWSLVDLPVMDAAPVSLAEEEAMGLRNAYLCQVDPECVIDWEEDERGDLLWVLVKNVSRKRMSLDEDRSMIVETYTHYTAKDWTRYTYVYQEKKPPKDNSAPSSIESGPHSFGTVPVRRLELPDGLWAGNKVASVAIELLRKQNSFSYGMDKGLFQQLVATLSAGKPGQELDADPNRAVNQSMGPGRVWVGLEGDGLEFIAPQAAPFEIAAKNVADLRDEMSRVLQQMAHAVTNQGDAMRRSAESKQVDLGAFWTIVRALGEFVRHHARELFETIAAGRGEGQAFVASGGDEFDTAEVSTLLEEAQILETLNIPSPTFKAEAAYEVVKSYLKNAEPQELERIKQELAKGFSVEEALAQAKSEAGSEDPAEDDLGE